MDHTVHLQITPCLPLPPMMCTCICTNTTIIKCYN